MIYLFFIFRLISFLNDSICSAPGDIVKTLLSAPANTDMERIFFVGNLEDTVLTS